MLGQSLPARDLPAGDLPAGDLPAGDLPAGDLPAGDLIDTAPKLALDIGADTLFVDGSARVATFTGHVIARRDGWVLECTSLEATYDENNELERATLTGPLSLSGEDLYAEAASATYEKHDELLVLEGNPLLKQGQSTLRAKRVTVQLETKKVEMTGVKGHLVFEPKPVTKNDAAD